MYTHVCALMRVACDVCALIRVVFEVCVCALSMHTYTHTYIHSTIIMVEVRPPYYATEVDLHVISLGMAGSSACYALRQQPFT